MSAEVESPAAGGLQSTSVDQNDRPDAGPRMGFETPADDAESIRADEIDYSDRFLLQLGEIKAKYASRNNEESERVQKAARNIAASATMVEILQNLEAPITQSGALGILGGKSLTEN